MGCVSSKRNINNLHPNIYEVVNVDEDGNKMSVGHLEVTETDLILRQKNKTPTVWPLKSLRRYGADSELFSFESGRRAPTGQGIYAFRCQRAEQLFNHLQAQFTAGDTAPSAPTPDSTEGPRLPNGHGRLDSIHSTGPISPPPISPPLPDFISPATTAGVESMPISLVPEAEEDSDGCDDSNNNEHPCQNYQILEVVDITDLKEESCEVPPPPLPPAYMNVEIIANGELSTSYSSDALSSAAGCDGELQDSTGEVLRDHLYMNIVPGFEKDPAVPAEDRVPPQGIAIIAPPVSGVNLPYVPKASQSLTSGPLMRGQALKMLKIEHDSEEDIHPYTNLSPSEREGLGLAHTPTQNLSYAVLDLDRPPLSPAISLTPTGVDSEYPVGPPIGTVGYVQIDFHRTSALQNSVNPNLMDLDNEGSRKTRHNSNINDLPTPSDS